MKYPVLRLLLQCLQFRTVLLSYLAQVTRWSELPAAFSCDAICVGFIQILRLRRHQACNPITCRASSDSIVITNYSVKINLQHGTSLLSTPQPKQTCLFAAGKDYDYGIMSYHQISYVKSLHLIQCKTNQSCFEWLTNHNAGFLRFWINFCILMP